MGNKDLENQITALNAEVARLKNENSFLKSHATLVRGMQGETLICKILNGQLTEKMASADVVANSIVRVEVKSSSLRRPQLASKRLRWQWSKPLGENNYGKDYDFLVLLGDK